MSSERYNYGAERKKIIFHDTDKRHVDLRIRLRHDGLTQLQFFQGMVTGYITGDLRIIDFITDLKFQIAKQGKIRIKDSRKLIDKGEDVKNSFSLTDEEKENIFDMIAKDYKN